MPTLMCLCLYIAGTAALYADAMFVESAYGEGNPTIAAQYMVNQLAQADVNFRRAYFNGLMGYGMAASTIRIYGDNEGKCGCSLCFGWLCLRACPCVCPCVRLRLVVRAI